MSHLLDYWCKPIGEENEDFGPFVKLEEEMNNLDIPLSLENAELMSSDFFDSVLSMERENFNTEIENNFLNSLNTEVSLSEGSSEHVEDVDIKSPSTISTDSDSFLLGTNNNVLFKTQDVSNIEDFASFAEKESFMQDDRSQMFLSQPTKLVVNGPATKRIILTKPTTNPNTKKILKNKQVIRVQPISGNGRSLLLPVNVKNMKKIKIINANDIKMEKIQINTNNSSSAFVSKVQIDKYHERMDDENETEYVSNTRHPPLNLTPEENRLLLKEGIQLPTHYPLTKNEEKELKRIRRKIRNKISAQDSRKRKKEYVDKLEEKAKRTSEENESLKKRIKLLKKQNGRLVEQMRKLHTMLFNTSTKATPTACLMIVLFSTLLVCLPNLRISKNKELGEQQLFAARRALLFNQKANEDDAINMEDFLVFNREEGSELEGLEDESENSTDNEFSTFLSELAKKYEDLLLDKNCSDVNSNHANLGEFCRKYEDEIKNVINSMKEFLDKEGTLSAGKVRSFIEPEISDDEEPVSKRIKKNEPVLNFEATDDNTSGREEFRTTVETKQYVA